MYDARMHDLHLPRKSLMKMSRVKHVLRTKDAIVIIAIDIDFFISLYLSLYLDTLTAHKQLIRSSVLYLVLFFHFLFGCAYFCQLIFSH